MKDLSNNKKRRLSKAEKAAVFSASVAVEQILMSFGNSALAECGGYGGNACMTITPNDFCVPENTAVTVNSVNFSPHPYAVALIDPDEEDYFPVYAEVVDSSTDTVTTPEYVEDYNNYPGGPPTPLTNFNYDFSFTSPEVAENSGTISLGNGRTEIVFDLYGEAAQWNGSSYVDNFDPVWDGQELSAFVDHVNTAPTISGVTTSESFEIDADTTTSYEVSAEVSDLESNVADITFELSDTDDFSNIIQTQTYADQSLAQTDQTFSHTWIDLVGGVYYWRIIVTETNASGVCTGFPTAQAPNNFTVQSDSDYTITQPTVLPAAGIGDGGYSSLLGVGILLIVAGKFVHSVVQSAKNSIINFS